MILSIDVVVVAFNRYDLTASCLAHLALQTQPHRVIVVDNGSTDGTAKRVAVEWPEVRVIRTAENRGFSKGTNTGVAAGDSDVVVLLNNDLNCRPGFLDRLVAPLESDPALGSVAALCVRPDGERIDSVGLTTDVTLSAFPRLQGRPVVDAASSRPVLVGPAGTAAAYRRSAWEAAGGFDNRIFAYNEDFDLALRLRAAGWETAAAPDAVGVHLGSASFGHRSTFQREHGGFGRGYLIRRHGLLRGRAAARTALTEAGVVVGDAVISRDLTALRGRVAGWRAASALPRLDPPPSEALDHEIGLREAIDLRRGVYARR